MLKGTKCSEETKKKMSKVLIGNKRSIGKKNALGHKWSEESKRKLSEARKGKKFKPLAKEHKKKLSESNKGKHSFLHSEETKRKISESLRGEKSPFWKGGIANDLYPYDWTDDLKESIRKRDDYICQICGIHQDELGGWNKKPDCHHIDYNKDNLNPQNLIILCRSCHIKTNFNRNYWINYFKDNNNFINPF